MISKHQVCKKQAAKQRNSEKSRGEEVTHSCQLFGLSVQPSIVVRRNDQAETAEVITAGDGFVATT